MTFLFLIRDQMIILILIYFRKNYYFTFISNFHAIVRYCNSFCELVYEK